MECRCNVVLDSEAAHKESVGRKGKKKVRLLAGIQRDSPTILSQETHFITRLPELLSLPCIYWGHVINPWTKTCKHKSCTSFQNTSLKIASTCSSLPLGSLFYPVAWEMAGVLASLLDYEDKDHILGMVEQ